MTNSRGESNNTTQIIRGIWWMQFGNAVGIVALAWFIVVSSPDALMVGNRSDAMGIMLTAAAGYWLIGAAYTSIVPIFRSLRERVSEA